MNRRDEVSQILNFLDWLDNFQELNDEEKAEMIANILYDIFKSMTPEQFKAFFKNFLLQNPELLDEWIERYKRMFERQLRQALRQKRKEIKVMRR